MTDAATTGADQTNQNQNQNQQQHQKQNQRAYATQEAAASVVCGGVAGSAFWLAVLPIDLAKTRYQIATPGGADDVGVWRLMARETSRTGARGLWVGVGPVLARAFPSNAVQFLAWEGACQLAGVRREHGVLFRRIGKKRHPKIIGRDQFPQITGARERAPAMVEITSADDAAGGGYKHDRRVIYPSYINFGAPSPRVGGSPKTPPATPRTCSRSDAGEEMKLPCEVETSYPHFWQRGRVRVTLKKEDATEAREFPTRRAVMLEIARLVPKHPGRQPGAPKDKKTMPTALEILTQFSSQPGQAGASSGAGGAGGGGGSSKKDKGGKKGKKGR